MGLGHWHIIALDLAPETSPELATRLPQGSLLCVTWSHASPGAEVLFSSDVWWQSDQVVGLICAHYGHGQ